MKMLQEVRGFGFVMNRQPQPRTPGLFLVQMRSHLLHASAAREKRTINIEMQAPPDLPNPIRIKHLKASSVPAATRPAP